MWVKILPDTNREVALMSTEEKRWEMMRFLAKNLDASEDDILDEAYRIAYPEE